MRTPLDNRQLIATDGMTHFNSASSQYARIMLDNRWNFPGDFCISIVARAQSLPAFILDAFCSDNGSRIAFSLTGANSGNLDLVTDDETVISEGFDIPTGVISRITLSRISGTLYLYVNARLVSGYLSAPGTISLFSGGDGEAFVGCENDLTDFLLGSASQILVVNGKGLNAAEVSEWHNSNIPPVSTHQHIVAHYRMNETLVDSIVDCVEDYNFAKSRSTENNEVHFLGSIPFVLGSVLQINNLTAAGFRGEVGVVDITSGKRAGIRFMESGNRVIGFNTVFEYAVEIDDAAAFFKIEREASVLHFYNESTSAAVSGLGTFDDPNSLYVYIMIYYPDKVINQSDLTLSDPEILDVQPGYGGSTSGGLYSRPGTLQANNHGDLINFTNTELGIPDPATKTVDRDFYNLSDPIDRTSDPQPRKALRLVRANSHRVEISNFLPTSEKGYTFVCIWKSMTEMVSTGQSLWGKRNGTYDNLLSIVQDAMVRMGQVVGTPSISQTVNSTRGFNRADLINTIIVTQENEGSGCRIKMFLNGAFEISFLISGGSLPALDLITGLFTVGSDPSGNYFDGYIMHMSVYKGVMHQWEQYDLININRPPARLWNDCHLYLNFDQINASIPFSKIAPTLSPSDLSPSTTGTYSQGSNQVAVNTGSDSDGDYIEFELINYASGFPGWSVGPFIPEGKIYKSEIKIKLFSGTRMSWRGINNVPGGGQEVLDSSVVGTSLLTRTQTINMIGAFTQVGALYFYDGSYSAINGSKFRIYSWKTQEVPNVKDFSPQNRFSQLANYSDNEVNPAHADYRLHEISSLMGIS